MHVSHMIVLAIAGQLLFTPIAFASTARVETQSSTAPNAPVRDWWTRFSDPQLNAYVTRALQSNLDLQSAQAKIEESNAVAKQMLAPLLPQITLDSSINAGPLESLGFQFGGSAGGASMGTEDLPKLYATTSTALKANLDLDIFGRQTLARNAALVDRDSQNLSRQDQQNRLIHTLVTAYFDMVTARAQLTVIEEQRSTIEAVLETTQRRFNSGEATALDILTQKQQLAAADARKPQAELQLRAFQHQFAILLGEEPGTDYATQTELKTESAPAVPAANAFEPQQKLTVQLAQVQLEATTLRYKRSRREWVPTVRLNGQYGIQSIHVGESRSQWFWGFGAALSFPLYQGGKAKQVAAQAQAQHRIAEIEVERRLLEAKKETADALSQADLRKQSLVAQQAQSEAAHAAFVESRNRYFSGISDYTTVLTALNTYQSAELNLITAKRDYVAALVNLQYLAAEQVAR